MLNYIKLSNISVVDERADKRAEEGGKTGFFEIDREGD